MTGASWAVERALELSRQADGCLAIADETISGQLRWASNALTTNGATRTRRLTVIVVADGGVGVVSQDGDLSEDAIARLVRAAGQKARDAEQAVDLQPLVAGNAAADWSEPAEEGAFDTIGGLVPQLAESFARARARGRLLYGYAERQVRTTYLASSTGLRSRHVQPTGVLDLTAKTADQSRSAWAGSGTTDLAGVDLGALIDQVDGRLALADHRIELPPARYEVLLPPSGVADLMLHLYQAAAARDALDGNSVFSAAPGRTRIGERLTNAPLTLYSDPREPGLDCTPFALARASSATASVFDNGIPLTRTDWITDGVLRSLVQTRRSAETSGLPCTPWIDNLVLVGDSPGRSLSDMIAGTRRGLLLTSLWYLRHVDPAALTLTGLTRDGVFLVENGEIVGLVHDFRFNESPVALLDRVTEIGRTERALPREWGDYFTRMAMPALRIEDFAMSSVSR